MWATKKESELTEKVRNKPYSVLLFDEVEKAHPDIFNVLLQVLDDGVLTDSKGRKIDFSNTIIIMTSNLGATAFDDKTVGFGVKDIRFDQANMEKRMFEELKKTYRPEFINRIDEKVVFHSLSSEDMQQVVKVMVKPLIATLAEQGMTLKFQPSALKLLATKGYDPEMGARPLRRVLQTEVEDQLAELLLKGQAKKGKPSRLERQPERSSSRLSRRMSVTLQRLTRISLLAARFVSLYVRLLPLSQMSNLFLPSFFSW